MLEPLQSRSTQPSADRTGSNPRGDGSTDDTERWLVVRRLSLPVSDYDFSKFAGRTLDDIATSADVHSDESRTLRSVIETTLQGWAQLKRSGGSVPEEGADEILKLLTSPGAITTVLRTQKGEFMGYGLVLSDPAHFPDRANIPDELLNCGKPVYRGIRLFIRDRFRTPELFGTATDKIIHHINERCRDGVVLTRVQVEPQALAYLWAIRAFTRIGFERTGHYVTYTDKLKSGETVNVRGEWFAYPPISTAAKQERLAVLAQEARVRRPDLARLGPAVHLRASRGLCAYVSREPARDALLLSGLMPHTNMVAVRLGTELPKEHRSPIALPEISASPSSAFSDAASLDGLFHSGTLPEVAAPAKGSPDSLKEFLQTQVAMLDLGGRMIIRNPIAPDSNPIVTVDLAANDGADDGPPRELSTAAWFARYLGIVRSEALGLGEAEVSAPMLPPGRDGLVRYTMPWRLAHDFCLKAPYREDLEREARRVYAPYRRDAIEAAAAEQGMRMMVSKPEQNPWITESLAGKVLISMPDGSPAPELWTNYLLVAERAAASEGVRIDQRYCFILNQFDFLRLSQWKRVSPGPGEGKVGQVMELVQWPNETLDVVPWFRWGSDLFIEVKDFPRPVVSVPIASRATALDQSRSGGYITEQISEIVDPSSLTSSEAVAATVSQVLQRKAGISASEILNVSAPTSYLPSPGGVSETVRSALVQITPRPRIHRIQSGISGLDYPGEVRTVEVRELIRACQSGTLPDARVERKVYELLLQERHPAGQWLGTPIELTNHGAPPTGIAPVESVLRPGGEPTFKPTNERSNFLQLSRGRFTETNAQGDVVAECDREYVEPAPKTGLGSDTLAILPVRSVTRSDGTKEFYIGVEIRDLPAAQELLRDTSSIATVPAYRLPTDINSLTEAEKFAADRLQKQFGSTTSRIFPLGGKYRPSPGVIPEEVYLYAAEVAGEFNGHWVKLDDALAHASEFPDGHLQTAIYRLSHAVGLIP